MNDEDKKTKVLMQAIFGYEPEEIETDPIILYEPDSGLLADAVDQLNSRYTKQQIWEMCRVLHPWLRSRGSIFKKTAEGRRVPYTEMRPLFSQNSYKPDLVKALAIVLVEPRNLQLYVDAMEEPMRQLWRRVLLQVYVRQSQAKKILGTSKAIISLSRSYYYGNTPTWAQEGFAFFSIARAPGTTVKYGYRETESFISISTTIHQFFFPVFFPDVAGSDVALTELPPDEDLKLFDCEAESVAKFRLMQGLLEQGAVTVRTRGVAQGEMKRVAQKIGLQEFFPDAASPLEQMLHVRFYVEMLTLEHTYLRRRVGGKTKSLADYASTLRNLHQHIDEVDYFLTSALLPHIKGLRKPQLQVNKCWKLYRFLAMWMAEEPERWVSVEDVFMKATDLSNSEEKKYGFMTMVFSTTDLKNDVEVVNEMSGRSIDVSSFVMEFGYTVLQAAAFMRCSLGMAQLVTGKPVRDVVSPFARARYLRLTPLGRYTLGIDKTYEPPHIDQKAYFELDPDRLIIRSLEDPNPYAQLLRDSSVPISKNRYETSASSFLAKCSSREDVENNIAIFKQFISSDLPPLWKQFFDSLLLHCNPLETDNTAYRHYRLSPENTDLIRLITTDPVLRSLVIRAEGYFILVRSDNQRKFEEQLKKHGYLL